MVSIKKLIRNPREFTERITSKDIISNNVNSLSKLCSGALMASMIYLGSMNVLTASSKYLLDHNTSNKSDTTITSSLTRNIVPGYDKKGYDKKTVDTSKMYAAGTSLKYMLDTTNADGATDDRDTLDTSLMTAVNANKGLEFLRSFAITSSTSNNPNKLISPNTKSMDDIIAYYAKNDNHMFSDNDYYKNLREKDALLQLKKYDVNTESTLMIVNKTFQKAMIIRMEKQPFIYSIDSLDSFSKQGKNFKISKNEPDKLVEMVLEPEIISEIDCSTAKFYGSKSYDGDAKTPEGIFSIYSVEDSHDWMFDGKWAYGPIFLRIKNAIGIHGNGTDTLINSVSVTDKRFKISEPLGIYSNNFAHGLSHGCIRLDNGVIYKLVNDGTLKNGIKVIIFENKKLTETLLNYYPASISYALQADISKISR